MLTINEIKTAVTKYGKKYGVSKAYLFGSYARNEATENSDVDILIEKGELNTYKAYSGLLYSLEDELGKHVDLLTTEGAKPRFLDLIQNDRVLIYGA